MSAEKMREAFEAWMRVDNTLPMDKCDQGYADFTTALMWHVWQAAQKAIAEKPSRTSDSGCTHEFVLEPSSSIKVCLHCGRSNIGLSKRAAPPAQPAQGKAKRRLTFNEWWLAIPEGRRKVLIDDKWALASAAYDAAPPAPTEQPAQGEAVEMSPEFTDTSRAALMWVLWHHQGGTSPVGQPIRFALGLGAHQPLSDYDVREAKRWAAMTKSTTAEFHAPPAPSVPDELTPKQIASACFALRHDYGLLPERERDLLAYQCREWWRAISKELNTPSQHPMVLAAAPEVPRG